MGHQRVPPPAANGQAARSNRDTAHPSGSPKQRQCRFDLSSPFGRQRAIRAAADLTPSQKLTLAALDDFADDLHVAWPSQKTIAACTNRQDRQVRSDLFALTKRCIIEKIGHASHGTIKYRIRLEMLTIITPAVSCRPENAPPRQLPAGPPRQLPADNRPIDRPNILPPICPPKSNSNDQDLTDIDRLVMRELAQEDYRELRRARRADRFIKQAGDIVARRQAFTD